MVLVEESIASLTHSSALFFTFGFELCLFSQLYLFGVIPRVYWEVMFQLPTKHSLTMTSTTPTIPIHLNCLPLYAVHALYIMVLDNPVAMVTIEANPTFQAVPLVCHYVRLFHHYTHAQINLSIAITLSPTSVKRQLDRLTVKQFETLQLLISVNWGRFFHEGIPNDLL